MLALFDRLQDIIDNLHQKRSYRFRFSLDQLTQQDLERMLERFRVGFRLRKVMREAQTVNRWYDVWDDKTGLQELSDFLLKAEHVLLVEYSA